jgi:hypothetical protein
MIPKYTPAAKPRNAPFEIKVADLKIFFLLFSEKILFILSPVFGL